MAYKVFTNGSVLNASEINDNLMNQSVMVFSNAAARTAAITSPIEGMLTWLEDVNRYESYNGSSWASPFASTFITGVDFTSASAVNLNNVFTSSYQNYSVLVNIQTASASGSILHRLRASGTDSSAGYYFGSVVTYSNSATVDSSRGHPGNSLLLTTVIGSEDAYGSLQIFSPNQARDTTMTFQFGGSVGALYTSTAGSCLHSSSVAYDGLSIYPSAGTITGTIRVYGMRNN